MTELLASYTKTFSSFAGSDIVGTINGKPCGEMQDVTYVEDLAQPRTSDKDGNLIPPITGIIHGIVFGERESSIRTAIKGTDDHFVLFLADEFGKKSSIAFEGFQAVKREGSFSVDDALFHEQYHFTAWGMLTSDRDWYTNDKGDIVFGTYKKPVRYEEAAACQEALTEARASAPKRRGPRTDTVRDGAIIYEEPEEVIGG